MSLLPVIILTQLCYWSCDFTYKVKPLICDPLVSGFSSFPTDWRMTYAICYKNNPSWETFSQMRPATVILSIFTTEINPDLLTWKLLYVLNIDFLISHCVLTKADIYFFDIAYRMLIMLFTKSREQQGLQRFCDPVVSRIEFSNLLTLWKLLC